MGEPITDAGKRKQLAKMLFLTLVPILILMGLSVYFMSESVRSRIESAKVKKPFYFISIVYSTINIQCHASRWWPLMA